MTKQIYYSKYDFISLVIKLDQKARQIIQQLTISIINFLIGFKLLIQRLYSNQLNIIQIIFKQMKKEHMQCLPKNKQLRQSAYNMHINHVNKLFEAIKSLDYHQSEPSKFGEYKEKSEELLVYLKKAKYLKNIKKKDSIHIYHYYLKAELQNLISIKGLTDINVKIIKATKMKSFFNYNEKKNSNQDKKSDNEVEEYSQVKIDWKQLWQRIYTTYPEIGFKSRSVEELVSAFKPHFDQNNAVDVWQYFSRNNQDIQRKMVRIFTRITKNTKKQIFQHYLTNLHEYYVLKKINKTQFMVLFIAATKIKKLEIKDEVDQKFCDKIIKVINQVFIELFTSISTNKKKGGFQLRINSSSAILLEGLLGKMNNKGSIYLLDHIFSLIKKFIKPLENSTSSVSFLYILFKYLVRRLEKEKKIREKLEKLAQKMKKKSQENSDAKIKEQQQEDQDQEQQEDHKDEDEDAQTDVIGQLANQGMAFNDEEQEDQEPDSPNDTDEQRKKKLQAQLSNQITADILQNIRKHLTGNLFEVLYFVNSKKTISHLLKYIYRIFPEFSIRSLQVLEKARNIPNLNQDGLIRNMLIGVECMFSAEGFSSSIIPNDQQKIYVEGVNNIMRILEKANNCRRIIDVWEIYERITSKVPLLDEKDLNKIPDEQKEEFLKVFGLNHDRFYQQYSQHVLQVFKRLLREGQFIEQADESKYNHSIAQIYCNSYPFIRKRLLSQVMEVVTEKPNNFAFIYFLESQLPKREEEILKNQLSGLNQQSEHTKKLRQNLLCALVKNSKLDELKPWIRKMAKDGKFQAIRLYILFKVGESINWQPLPTSLSYFYDKYNTSVVFDSSTSQIQANLKQIKDYLHQLCCQVYDILKSSQEAMKKQISESDDAIDRIIDTYKNNEKIKTQKQRKSIFQILNIIHYLNSSLQPSLLSIKQKKAKKIQMIDSGVTPYGFMKKYPQSNQLQDKRDILSLMLSNKQILNDQKITKVLSYIIINEYFMFNDMISQEKKKIKRQSLKNKNHQMPECVNRLRYGNQYIAKSRLYMGSNLQAKYSFERQDIDHQNIEKIFILATANGNDNTKQLLNILKNPTERQKLKQLTLKLIQRNQENRFLIKKISTVFGSIVKYEICFTEDQILLIMDYHRKLLQSNDVKVRQNANKSLKKALKILNYNQVTEKLHDKMQEFLKIEKMEMIWLIYVILIMAKPEIKNNSTLSAQLIHRFLLKLQPMILDDFRSVRRLALYIYSVFIRKLKKIKTEIKQVEFKEQIKRKDLNEFIETGYLRPQFYSNQLKDKKKHIRCPQNSYKIKVSEFQYKFFDLLIKNPDNAIKFIKTFHSDMVASTEMLISAYQSSMLSVDLFSVATKALEGIFFFTKTRDMTFLRAENLVGSRFFKYLCLQDAHNGYKFFKTVKGQVLDCLKNLQSLDNQTLIFIYTLSILNAYERREEKSEEIEQFILTVFREIIDKSSGLIFQKFIKIFFDKPRIKSSIDFILNMLDSMIRQKKQLCRVSEIMIRLQHRGYKKMVQTFQMLMNNSTELQKAFVEDLLYEILTFPENNAFKISDIEKTGVIDLQKHVQQKRLVKQSDSYVLLNIEDFHNSLISSLSKMIDSEKTQEVKTAFNLINKILQTFYVLVISEQNMKFLKETIKLGIRISNNKQELQLENYTHFNTHLIKIISTIKYPTEQYAEIFDTIIESIEQTNKRSIQILKCLVASPINIFQISPIFIKKYVLKVLDLYRNSSLFKQALFLLSTLFMYYHVSEQFLQDLIKECGSKELGKEEIKKRSLLIIESYLLAENQELNGKLVREVIRGTVSNKDNRNIWAREMMLIRGRRQYFDSQETHEVWKQIKEISNPYNYIA